MHRKLFCTPLVLFFLINAAFSQIAETAKKNEISADLKKEAVAFLRESAAEIAQMRTLENRIGLSAEMANLMWYNDEKEARAMFQTVIGDFRQLLTNYDAQFTALGETPEISDNYSGDSSEKTQLTRKFVKAISVRQQIADALAEHDPQLAFEFFTSSATAISNPNFHKQIEGNDIFYEARLLNKIADKNPDLALKYGRQTLAKNFSYEILSLLQKVYDKDAAKGAAFAEDIVSKLKSDASKPEGFYNLSRTLSVGVENLDAIKGKAGKRPMFSEQALRDLADLMTQELLKREDAESYELANYIDVIERVSPARAAQIRQKFDIKKKKPPVNSVSANGDSTVAVSPPGAMVIEGKSEKEGIVQAINVTGKTKLSDEEKKNALEQAKKIIAEIPDREQKFLALAGLAAQIAQAGDKELAATIMIDARNFINLQPKNYRDYMQIWMLASAYAQTDADKAFPLLEDSIFRLNETIAAFIKVGEFMDATDEIIADGEIQIGGFGGEISRELTRNLGASDATIRSLAIADFKRTKALSEKFERQEVRILAKLLVLRAVLADKKTVAVGTEEF